MTHNASTTGGPAAPDVVLRMVNPRLIVLQWDPPFTWNHTTIEYYTITSSNPNWNQNTYTLTELEIAASEPECALYTFTVLANNGIDDGEAATVTGGFPIGKIVSSIVGAASTRESGGRISMCLCVIHP